MPFIAVYVFILLYVFEYFAMAVASELFGVVFCHFG